MKKLCLITEEIRLDISLCKHGRKMLKSIHLPDSKMDYYLNATDTNSCSRVSKIMCYRKLNPKHHNFTEIGRYFEASANEMT